jgi:hypothetical protein
LWSLLNCAIDVSLPRSFSNLKKIKGHITWRWWQPPPIFKSKVKSIFVCWYVGGNHKWQQNAKANPLARFCSFKTRIKNLSSLSANLLLKPTKVILTTFTFYNHIVYYYLFAQKCFSKNTFKNFTYLLGPMLRSQFSAIFANFWRKKWRFSQKPMLWSHFCII